MKVKTFEANVACVPRNSQIHPLVTFYMGNLYFALKVGEISDTSAQLIIPSQTLSTLQFPRHAAFIAVAAALADPVNGEPLVWEAHRHSRYSRCNF